MRCTKGCKLFKLVLEVTWTCDWLVVFSPQSAALQKKLRHLEVQLNNEKQAKDELDHKYRYRSCRNITQLFSFALSQISNVNSIFQNNKFKSLNNQIDDNRFKCFILSSKLHLFWQLCKTSGHTLHSNHLHIDLLAKPYFREIATPLTTFEHSFNI